MLDEKYAKTGYALYAFEHTAPVIRATPHCRVRLSGAEVNISSHAATLMRYEMAERPDEALILASMVNIAVKEENSVSVAGIEPDRRYWDAVVFDSAEADSNGRDFVLEIIPRRKRFSRRLRRGGWSNLRLEKQRR